MTELSIRNMMFDAGNMTAVALVRASVWFSRLCTKDDHAALLIQTLPTSTSMMQLAFHNAALTPGMISELATALPQSQIEKVRLE